MTDPSRKDTMPEGMPEDLRAKIAGLSPAELNQLLGQLLAHGVLSENPAWPARPDPVVLPEPPADDVALTVRCDVDDAQPPVWRRLVLRGDLTLDVVHEILQAAYGWLDMHLHRFWPGPAKQNWRGPYFTTPFDEESGEEDLTGLHSEADVRLDQVLVQPGDRLFYTYDFGDDWAVTLKLESVAPGDPESEPAVCTKARMAGPLEDCGGIPGHQELVEAFRAGGLEGLPEDLRSWVPPGWDPFDEDAASVNTRLALVGKSTAEVLAAFAELSGRESVTWPESLVPLVEVATPDLTAELLDLCQRARDTSVFGVLTDEDVERIARPYRYLLDIAGDEGIPLTQAGWMKPAVVQRIYDDLGYAAVWPSKGNREDSTLPIADLRARCQQVGLLRKHKGRLLRTTLARSLSTDEDIVRAVAGRLVHHRDRYVESAQALYALYVATTGEPSWDHRIPVADALTKVGLRTGLSGVEPQHAFEWCRDLSAALSEAEDLPLVDTPPTEDSRRRTAGLARLALWP